MSAGGVLLFGVLSRFTHHPGETVILLMPLVFGGLLWCGWPRLRRVPPWRYALYPLAITPIVAAALGFAAYAARGRLLWREVFWAVYFIVAWRIAWALWAKTVGVLGERYRRWGRRTRRRAGGLTHIPNPVHRRRAAFALLISPLRFSLVMLIFAPLVAGSLIHRFKIGNRLDVEPCASWPIESVRFKTDDGLTISGWFLPDGGSDSTVVVCHGAGANKGNFVEFLSIFYEQGYNSRIFDFRGHGESDGHTCTFGLFEEADVRAAVDWLKTQRPAQARHVYALGSSMGAMALVRAAAQDKRIEAVVLDSAFLSAPMLARQHTETLPLIGPALGNIVLASMSLHAGRSLWGLEAGSAISALSPRPVMLIHGEDDRVIPPVQAQMLYELARDPKSKWLAPGLHSNIMSADFSEYQRRVVAFIDQVQEP